MPSISNLPPAEVEEIRARLKRIEGQARGVQKMVDEGRDCIDILNQLAAIKAAVNGLSGELLEAYAIRCLEHPEDFPSQHAAIEQAVRALVRSGR
jgi:CsoR family transcriptional regulator, copper-sensing transcriptional repressor